MTPLRRAQEPGLQKVRPKPLACVVAQLDRGIFHDTSLRALQAGGLGHERDPRITRVEVPYVG